MILQQNRLLFSGSIVDVYALQAYLEEQGVVATIYDPAASAFSAGFGGGVIGVLELYVNDIDFETATQFLDQYNQSN